MKNSTRINRAIVAKKKFFLFLTLLTLSVGQMWANYTITFNGTNSESTTISTSTTAASITGSSSYVTGNVVTATKAYGATSGGIKLGTSSASGTIKVNLSSSGQVTPKKILVNCKLYNSKKAATLGVNGSTKQSIGSDYDNLSFTITSAITYIQLDVTKYAWVKYVRVVDCDAPTAVAKGTVTSSSVALTITDASNVDTYEVYYSTSPTAPNDGTTASTTVNTKTPTVTGLNANTTYYLWVRSKCSNTSKSDWCALTGSSFTTAAAAPSYTITAQSNNTNYGTVSLSGSVITGSPKSGSRYASPAYSVSPANSATVSQSGNAFTVTPSASTTVTINFEAIPTHKISFNTGGLTTIGDATGIQEGAVYNITQTPAASLTPSCEYGTFVGWTTASSIANPSVKPALVSSVTMSTSNVTLYAVYSKTTGGGGSLTANFDGDWNSVFSTNYSGSFNPTANSLSLSGTVDGVTVSATNGTSKNGYIKSGDSDDWRLYNGYTLTISSSNNITGITFTDGGKTFSNISTSTGTLSGKTWTGNATSISFSITGTCGIGTIAVTYSSAGTTTYSLNPNCCEPLAQINGSVNLSQEAEGSHAGELKATWQLEGTTGIGTLQMQLWKKGSPDTQVGDAADVTINASAQTKYYSGLDHCATYYVKLVATKDAGTYCTDGWTEQSNEVTTVGYSIATNPVGGGLSLSPNKSIACAGDVFTITANSPDGSHEGTATILVTDGESNDITTSVLSGSTLTMPSSDITITATYAEKTSPSVGVSVAALDFESPKKGASVDAQTFSLIGSALTVGTLTLVAPSGYTVSPSSIEVASAGNLSAQTITVTPNTGTAGTFNGSISVSGAGVASTDIVSLTMTVLETYTVNWYVNGQLEHSQTDVANTDYDEVPSDFSAFKDCEDLTFVGWKEGAIDGGSTTSAPSLATIGTKITADKNYYAVFAEGTAGSEVWEKATSIAEGDYLIASEGEVSDVAYQVAFDGSLTTLDAVGNKQDVTISGGELTLENADNYVFTFAAAEGNNNYTIQSHSGYYIGQTSDANSLQSSTETSYANNVTFDGDGNVVIVSSSAHLRYNGADNQTRFRYYKSSSYSGQKDIQLYKKNVTPANWTKYYTTCPHYYTISLTNDGIVEGKGSFVADKASALAGESVQLTATETANAGRFNSWSITNVDLTEQQATTNPLTISMPNNDITVSATFDALYAITKDQQNGTITLGADYAAAGDNVTISASANPQYKNPVLTVFETGNESNTITVSAGAFTMPAYGVTARVVCEPAIEPLAAPVLGEATDATYQGVTLNWTGVAGNEGYVLTVQQGGVDVEGLVNVAIAQNATSYTIASGLAANTDYTYSIYTKGNGTTTMEVNTPANGNFSTEDYPNVTLYYSENGELSAGVSQKILTDFELADPASDPCTKKFVGWSTVTVAETDAEPAMMAPGATYQIPTNANCTLYAVYATEVPGETVYALTPATSLSEGTFVIAAYEGGDDEIFKALTGEVSSGDLVNEAIGFAIDDNKIVSLPNNACEFTFTAVTGGYSIQKPNGDYLGYTSTSDNRKLAFGEYSSLVWSATAHSKDGYPDNGLYLSTSAYRVFHNTTTISTSMIRGYKSTQAVASPIYLFKKTTSDATYSAYATTCTGKVATPSFSGITDGETYEEDKTVSLGCATGEATIRYTMSNDGTTPADPTGESTAATSISLNADGVYVIKAKAFKDGMDASDVATISVTINKPCTTIASFIDAEPSTAKKLVFTAESNAVVLGVNTNRIYIQDPTGGLLLYKTAHEKTWTKGKKVVGTIIGTYELTDNSPRMVVTDFGETVATADGEIPSAVVIEGAINAENFAANRNKLVTVSDLHFQAQSVGSGYSINITRGDDTYQIYNAFNALTEHVLPLTETACSVTGILGYHSSKYQLMPIDANCITTGATAVLPEFVGETGGADAEHPTEVASGEVIKLTAAEGMTSNYTIGESAPVMITTNTEAVISGANDDLIAITISAEREYYATNSVTYYYKINNALTKYIITSAVAENGTFKVKNSDASAEITSAVAGVTVTLVAEPTHTETAQYSLDHWIVYETGNTSNTVSVENNQFIMPSFAVTVSATFAEDAYATVVFDGGDATGTAPTSEKKYVGQEVTMPNKGALVKANHVLASWTYNETEYAVGDTYEIQAGDAAIGGNEITFTANWTPYPWANGGDWMLVTNAAEVTAGSYVIIAAAASNVAMSTTQNNNNRAQQTINKNDNLLTYTTAPAIFEVRAGNIENTLAFYDVVNEGYIYAAGSGKGNNHLKTETTLSNNSSWNVAILNTGVAEMQAQGTNNHDKLQYNSSSSIFSCYGSFDQASVSLYKYYAPVPKVTYDKNTEDEVTNMPNPSVQRTENNKAVIAAGPSRTGYTFEGWKNGNTTYTVGEEYTFTEDITLYAQWAALPSFHVTYNTSGSQGTTPTDATDYYEGDEVTLASASGLSNAGYFFDQWVATYVDNNSETQTLVIEDGKFTMPAFNVTVTATWARKSSDKWIKVTATSQLAADKEYIIVNTDATYAVGAQGSNNRTAAAIEENNGILTISDAVAKFTLGIPEAGKYTFENGGKYLYASSDTKNYLHERAENSDANGIWTINIGEEGAATVTATGTNTRNIMRYNPNNGSPVFSCYASSSSVQNPVVLYYKAPKIEINDSESVNVSDAAGSDIVIHEGGILTVDASASIGDLTVEAGGQVVLDANKLTVVGTFTIETTMASGKSGQLNGATASNFEAQEDAYIDITLGDNGNPEKWHAFTVPFPVDAINGIYDLDGKKLVNEVNYAIMDYHGDIRATGAYGWKKYRGVLVPGTFYLMTVDGERTTYRFKKTANGAIVAGNTKALYEYASSTGGNDNGWNGVGNPTLMYGTVDQNVQVLNPVSYTYEPYTAGNQNFVVGTPFFVQAASDGTMTMSAADGSKQYYAPARQAAKEIKDVKVTFGNEEYTDKLYISASEDALNEYETGKDLAKMTMTSTPKVAQIFGKAYNAKLCMVYAPMANDQAVYDLTLYAPANGEYTIAAPNVENADLYLTYEGSIIWDLTMGAYTNNFAKGNNEGYGLLLQAKMPMTPTGVDEVQSDKVQCTKVVIDDHVYILRGGQMYDVTGKAVK